MLETDTEKNSSYGSKPALPRAGEQKKRACEEFQYDFSNGTKRSEARPEETYFYGENQPMMFEETVKAKNGGGSKNAEKGLAVFLTVAAVLLALVSAFSILTGFGIIKIIQAFLRKQRLKPRRIPTKAQITYTTPVFPQRLRKARLHPARASRPANDVVSQCFLCEPIKNRSRQ